MELQDEQDKVTKKKKKRSLISFREKSVAEAIRKLLLEYGEYPLSKVSLYVERKERTIEKVAYEMERQNLIILKPIPYKKDKMMYFSKYGSELFCSSDCVGERKNRKVSRRTAEAEAAMMFNESSPPPGIKNSSEYSEIREFKKMYDDAKVATATRVVGCYTYNQMHYAVYHLGIIRTWLSQVEMSSLYVLRYQYYKSHVSGAIIFVDDYEYTVDLLLGRNRKYGEKRLNPETVSRYYTNQYVFPVDRNGIEQLKIFRCHPDIERLLKDIVIDEPLEKDTEKETYCHGKTDGVSEYAGFLFNLSEISRLRGALQARSEDTIIYCYSEQEKTYKEVFEKLDCVKIVTYTTKEVIGALGVIV